MALCRLLVNFKRGKLLLYFSFVFLLVTWFTSRCVIFPRDLVYGGVYASGVRYHLAWTVHLFEGLLWSLVFLHYYWFGLFMRMAYNLIFEKKISDLVEEGVGKREKKRD